MYSCVYPDSSARDWKKTIHHSATSNIFSFKQPIKLIFTFSETTTRDNSRFLRYKFCSLPYAIKLSFS